MEASSRKRPNKRTKGLSTPQRKARRAQKRREYNKQRIILNSEQYQRWLSVRERLGVQSDSEVMKVVLDRFELPVSAVQTSTPIKGQVPKLGSFESDFEADDEDEQPLLSQLESDDMPSTSGGGAATTIEKGSVMETVGHIPTPSTSMESTSIQDQSLDISVEYTRKGDYVYTMESESEDSDISWEESNSEEEQSWSDISEDLNENHPEGRVPFTVDDVFEAEERDSLDVGSEDEGAGQSAASTEEIIADQTCIAYSKSILQVLVEIPVATCIVQACQSVPQIKQKKIGTALRFTWECDFGHISKKWDSQPKVKRNFAGDLGLSAAILFSGNNYSKVKMLFKCLNLGICNSTLHWYAQRTYTCPAINEYWEGLQREILDARSGQEVVISGDGRNDSPGFSAQYCTYTTMDYHTNDILHVAVVDKREVGLKSPNMEKAAFISSLQFLQENNLKVKEVVTDAHPSIRAYLKQQPDIYHSSDVWHGAKNIGKKLAEVSKKAANRPLLQWTGDVTRHFWYCCSKADGDRMKLLSRWKGLLHHVTGKHEWVFGDGGGPAQCEHGPLPESWKMKTIAEGSPAHIALREIVLDQRLINSFDYYTKFRHTGLLENFQSHILAYAAKRFAYSYPSYKARNLLAAIDFQKHKDRRQLVGADGTPKYRRLFHKGSERWGIVPEKEAKTFSYIPELMKNVFVRRLQDPSSERSSVVLGEDDPRRMAPTIAPSQPPPTDVLVQEHESRF
ncbi:hypothetical protein HOLleu_31320 [Holothuria leucospilota]|uniref:Uncharacterized protein n=1 Tax=Holothuria leucospilota TaxID=206669 RepID=A0A9Q0YT50_HOLLE|nr:hypothetical protein HOLleu_31320 [Holothuria leucospilota]